MLIATISILGGLVLLGIGAEALIRGSSSVALRFGIAPIVVGLTVVAFGTGSPEFVVSLSAAASGNSGIALGNVIGSNISNVALILGVAALVRPLNVRARVLRREMPLLIAVTGLLWLLLYDGILSRFDGALLAVGCVTYTFLTYRLSRRQPKKDVAEEYEEAIESTGKPAWFDASLIVGGLIGLIAGANVFLNGAVTVAQSFGMSEVTIGLTIVAIGTSLPELATSAMAAYKDEPDIAFGNALGSNVLNILAVLGITAIVQPIASEGVRTIDLGVMLGSVLLLYLFLGRRFVLDRVEGTLLVLGYVAYIYSLLW